MGIEITQWSEEPSGGRQVGVQNQMLGINRVVMELAINIRDANWKVDNLGKLICERKMATLQVNVVRLEWTSHSIWWTLKSPNAVIIADGSNQINISSQMLIQAPVKTFAMKIYCYYGQRPFSKNVVRKQLSLNFFHLKYFFTSDLGII